MGKTVPCQKCARQKSPLATECVGCGHNPYKRIRRVVGGIRKVPAGRGIVRGIHAKWHQLYSKKVRVPKVDLDAHVFCEHVALLRKLKLKFDGLDAKNGFDDIWFFLRGGFPYFAFLNTSSRMKLRAIVFPGLAVPDIKTKYFTHRVEGVLKRAIRLRLQRIDIAAIDEVDSGSGMNRLHKLLARTIAKVDSVARAHLRVVVHRIMVKRKKGTPKIQLKATLRKTFPAFSNISAAYRDVILEGEMLGYDDAEILGLVRSSKTHRYRPKLYSAAVFHLTCPRTQGAIYESEPVDNDIPTFISGFSSDLASGKSHFGTQFLIRGLRLSKCNICKKLEKTINPKGQIPPFKP